MNRSLPKPILYVTLALLGSFGHLARAEEPIGFNRTIRPLLAAKCLACHGPDEEERKAELRLDVRESAVDAGAIVPDKPDDSELLRRIFSEDPDERMPPPDSGESLTEEEKQQLRRWINDGATYEQHWAFVPPQRPEVPAVSNPQWARNDIDRFVLARLEAEQLSPSVEADRYTLVRRLYLDLIGLPPSPEEADAFASSDDPKAYDELVDRLLKSQHYGERWARAWLDLARYSDTNGYEKDRPRTMWSYRDWVIKALNVDMPFDQFTIEQLAGDMLPNATNDQRVATGFHRNTMLNEEGGIDPLEYRFYAMVDRVATTGAVWMGLTTGCAQCHTHKYDPISHTDYYSLMALLNNADEPDLLIPDDASRSRRQEIEAQIAELESKLPTHFPPAEGDEPVEARREKNLDKEFGQWLATKQAATATWSVLRPTEMKTNLPRLEVLEDGSILSSGDITKRDVFTLTFDLTSLASPIAALRLEALPDERLPSGGPGRCYYEGRKGDFFLSELDAAVGDSAVEIASASHSYGKISIGSGSADAKNVLDGDGSTGWSTSGREGQTSQLVLNFARPLEPSGTLTIEMLFERHFAASLGRFRFSTTVAEQAQATETPIAIESLLVRDSSTWNAQEAESIRSYFLSVTPLLAEARKPIDELRNQLPEAPAAMVMSERTADHPRATHRHHRGEYLSPREPVGPAILDVFTSLTKTPPKDRLEFARWLVSDANPLAARVTVDRAWLALFGAGLMRSNGDFGTQADPPTHPELLDWLAIEFVERGWSMKELHRSIVSSATYRQASHVSKELLARDPENRLLARGPRYRVDAEMVRDMMLAASGRLSPKMFGPSVYPPQPASVTELSYGNMKWEVSPGEDRYRRSLYTFSKRTAPFAAYTVFDGPTGENCVPRRNRSNTPLQALTLLNDEMYLELARAVAEYRTSNKELPTSKGERATEIFRRFVTRPPSEPELAMLLEFQAVQQKRLEAGELDPKTILAIDSHEQTPNAESAVERASWVMVARAIMNLDEAITKQ
ncbi:MAG: PSD1 and planctomycete cytochrome C domain-containing protein [Planctomycetota bacterium]|nr:PSD1 and planctomycete cytochrome C domain-containing protein [Planctomycetota bacterium]